LDLRTFRVRQWLDGSACRAHRKADELRCGRRRFGTPRRIQQARGAADRAPVAAGLGARQHPSSTVGTPSAAAERDGREARDPITVDIHCVTKSSKLDTVWRGVSVDTLLDRIETAAKHVIRCADGGYTTAATRGLAARVGR